MTHHPLSVLFSPHLHLDLPPDWEVALAAVSKYFGWSRADAWDCSVKELRWWAKQMEELEK